MYEEYRKIQKTVWKCLIDSNINCLPVSVGKIATTTNIKIIGNSKVNMLECGESGLTVRQDGITYIIYDETENSQRSRFTVAHELGHIFLGHLDTKQDIQFGERSANMFAIRLLAPACILHEMNCTTAKDIANICNIFASISTTSG